MVNLESSSISPTEIFVVPLVKMWKHFQFTQLRGQNLNPRITIKVSTLIPLQMYMRITVFLLAF